MLVSNGGLLLGKDGNGGLGLAGANNGAGGGAPWIRPASTDPAAAGAPEA